MIKIIITTIILFIIFIIILLSFNVKIEYFSNIIISKTYVVLTDNNRNEINPTVWFKFDNNQIPHFNDGTSANNWTSTNATITNSDFTKGSGSLLISSSSKIISTPSSFNISNKSFTISYWIKSPFTENNHIFGRYGGTGYGSFPYVSQYLLLSTYSSTGFSFSFNYDDLYVNLSSNEFNSYKNVWTHFAYVFYITNKRRELYINGILRGNDTSINPYRANDNGQYIINESGVNTNTYIDDFRIYAGTALSEDQVYELYTGYKKIGEVIETSTNCSANMTASGAITEIPDPNMNINVISTITKRNDHIYSQSFGNGTITYNLTFSKYFNDDYIPSNLLLRNNKLTAFTIDNYNNNGDYTGIFTTNLPENLAFGLIKYPQKGEFIHIRFPSSIILKRYGFIADPQWISREPGTWALYAGNRLLETSNVNSTLLINNTTRLNNNSYCSANEFKYIHDIKDNNTSGNELLFIFPSLASSTSPNNPGRILSFMQLLLFSA